MATVGSDTYNLINIAKHYNNGKMLKVANLLEEVNDIHKVMPFVPANDGSRHISAAQATLPKSYKKIIGEGVASSVGTVTQQQDNCAITENWMEIEDRLVEKYPIDNGSRGAFLKTKEVAHMESLMQEKTEDLFYSNQNTNLTAINGFFSRYNSSTGNIGRNVIKGVGTGATNMSCMAVTFEPEKIFGIYPEGSAGGLQTSALEVNNFERDSKNIRLYKKRFAFECGLVVADWRYGARLANVDVNKITTNASDKDDLIRGVQKLLQRLHKRERGKTFLFMNRTFRDELDLQLYKKLGDNGGLTYKDVSGMYVDHFRETPILIVDGLKTTEAAIS